MADETKKNKDNKRFFKDFKAELKKVIWPSPKQIVNNTIAVVTIVIVTAIIVFVLDLAFEAINTYGINKLRNLIPESNTITENITEGEEQDTSVTDNENGVENSEENVENNEETVQDANEGEEPQE